MSFLNSPISLGVKNWRKVTKSVYIVNNVSPSKMRGNRKSPIFLPVLVLDTF